MDRERAATAAKMGSGRERMLARGGIAGWVARLVAVALVGATLALMGSSSTAYAAFVSAPAAVVSLDTSAAGPTPAWTRLASIAISELSPDDLAPGQGNVTLVLRAPAGWEFRPGTGAILAAMFFGDVVSDGLVVSSDELVITLTTDDVADSFDVIMITGLQVRPTTLTPGTAAIYRPAGVDGGTAQLAGVFATANADGRGGTSFGSLTAVAPVTP